MKSIKSQPRIVVIGLGLMGTAIVDRLLEHHYGPCVWNRTPEKAEPLLDRGAVWNDNSIADCDRVTVSLNSSEVVESVLQHLKSSLRPGQTVIDTTTGELALRYFVTHCLSVRKPACGLAAHQSRGQYDGSELFRRISAG